MKKKTKSKTYQKRLLKNLSEKAFTKKCHMIPLMAMANPKKVKEASLRWAIEHLQELSGCGHTILYVDVIGTGNLVRDILLNAGIKAGKLSKS